jgi:hypothetical protein
VEDRRVSTDDAVTDDDKERLTAIMDATNPEELARLLFEYYHDADRGDRTSRSQMYLHMGMLTGAVMRALRSHR